MDSTRDLSKAAKDQERDCPQPASSRRDFLAQALAAASGLALSSQGVHAEPQTPPGCAVPGAPLIQPAEFVSQGNKLEATLTVAGGERSVAVIAQAGLQCNSVKLRYYQGRDASGKVWPASPTAPGPGPTLRARVGDDITIHMFNQIDPALFGKTTPDDQACNVINVPGSPTPLYPGTDTAPSCFHGNNITNMHYHGTHVSPEGSADNVMIGVVPRSQKLTPAQNEINKKRAAAKLPPEYYVGKFDNRFKITTPPAAPNPTNQPMHMGQAPGTHWYHAHKHGSVALQLLNGMAGAFIIEGEFDAQLETLIPGLRSTEKVLVIQQLGDVISINPGPPLNAVMGGSPFPLVNGQIQPTIEMRPGEIQRWRIVNATMQQTAYIRYRFTSAGTAPVIRQVAYDGVQLAPERYNDPIFGQSQDFTLAPGNRVDILVQAPSTPGQANLSYTQANGSSTGILVQLNVTGTPVTNMNFPTAQNYPQMPFWLQWDTNDPRNAIKATKTLQFNSDATGRPAIDGLAFDGKTTVQYVKLNTAEEWILENYWDSSIHPFHIHVNPFQVLEIFNPNLSSQVQLQAPYNWMDTIAIPPSKTVGGGPPTPGRVRIRQRFLDFPGTFVLHCHILDHEDRGMMQEVVVVDPENPKVSPLVEHH